MNPQIPTNRTGQFNTRNTKEAALMYAIDEVKPCTNPDGSMYAFRTLKDGEEVCWFCFQESRMANLIHSAFTDKTWEQRHSEPIPDEYMPAVLTLIKQMWHNWERLKDATKSLPLHTIVQKGNRIYIAAKENA